MDALTQWGIPLLAGAVSGFIGAMGLGGGGVLILYLTLICSLPQNQASGMNLVFFLPIAVVALLVHRKQGTLFTHGVGGCIVAGAAGALCGTYLAHFLHPQWLSKGFAGLVFFMGLRELFGRLPSTFNGKESTHSSHPHP